MDILHLVDRLEELFNESRPIPFTNNVIVDEDRMLDIIDQMRVAIPDQVKQAEKLLAERDRTLAGCRSHPRRGRPVYYGNPHQSGDRDGTDHQPGPQWHPRRPARPAGPPRDPLAHG